MDNRMENIDKYIYMSDGTIVYESLYQKQFTPEEFRHLLAICEDNCDGERINYNAVEKEWQEERDVLS